MKQDFPPSHAVSICLFTVKRVFLSHVIAACYRPKSIHWLGAASVIRFKQPDFEI